MSLSEIFLFEAFTLVDVLIMLSLFHNITVFIVMIDIMLYTTDTKHVLQRTIIILSVIILMLEIFEMMKT